MIKQCEPENGIHAWHTTPANPPTHLPRPNDSCQCGKWTWEQYQNRDVNKDV